MLTVWALPAPTARSFSSAASAAPPPPRFQVLEPSRWGPSTNHPFSTRLVIGVNVMFRGDSAAGRGEHLISHFTWETNSVRKKVPLLSLMLDSITHLPPQGSPGKWGPGPPAEGRTWNRDPWPEFHRTALLKGYAHVFQSDNPTERNVIFTYFLKTCDLHLFKTEVGEGNSNNREYQILKVTSFRPRKQALILFIYLVEGKRQIFGKERKTCMRELRERKIEGRAVRPRLLF